jgi:hypothetical protein
VGTNNTCLANAKQRPGKQPLLGKAFNNADSDTFSMGPTQGYIRKYTRVEAGSNTSTVTLRVVGGDEKGSLKSERVKYGRKSQGTKTRETLRWQGPAAHTKDRPVLSSERAPHGLKNVTVRRIPYSERRKNLVVSPG